MTQSILVEAARLVDGARQSDYGHPADDFKRIATIWSALLENKLNTDLTSSEVGAMMIALKLSRTAFKNKRDNYVIVGSRSHMSIETEKYYLAVK